MKVDALSTTDKAYQKLCISSVACHNSKDLADTYPQRDDNVVGNRRSSPTAANPF